MRSVFSILVLLLLASLACSPTCAQSEDNNASQPDAHVSNYGCLNPSCQRWSDGCRVCTREGCSNIGTACQPAEVKCITPADSPDPKFDPPR
jgi:hypothetical protein